MKALIPFKIIILVLLILQMSQMSCSAKKGDGSSEINQGSKVTHVEAQAIVEKIPEVENFIASMAGQGEASASIRLLDSKTENEEIFEFYVGESHKTHTTLWNVFGVNKKTGEILVYDSIKDEFIPLKIWRQSMK